MILARIAVFGSIVCTLWWNASYAAAKGGSEFQQYAMVATAVTIDLCKCGFLPAASHLWRNAWRVPATVLVLLWPLTFAYSAFSGFASITTNRSITSAATEGQAQQRSRDQATYDQATAALNLAMTSPLWTATAACSSTKTNKQRDFCDNIATTKSQQEAVGTTLNGSTPAQLDPEVTVLKENTGLSMPTLQLIIAAGPALILELVSSLGFYAISKRSITEAPRTPAKGPLRSWLVIPRRSRENHSTSVPGTSAVSSTAGAVFLGKTPPTPTLTWNIPASG